MMHLKKIHLDLNKNDTLIIKGLAIISIILHNYFHLFKGIIIENEFEYHSNSFSDLWVSLSNSIILFIINFLSLYGHYGVVAFFFVSGYGLASKYKNLQLEQNFIFRNTIKLWRLFVPILTIYIILSILKSFLTVDLYSAIYQSIRTLYNALYRLLFISNFSTNHVFDICGPWWFFSAILQLYILYKYIFSKSKSSFYLIIIAISMIVLQIFIYNYNPNSLKIIRYNSPAWIPTFILGILTATHKIKIPIILFILLGGACFLIDASPFTWILGYSFFIIAFLSVLYIIKKTCCAKFFIWTGQLSAYLFVINVFVRTFIYLTICNPMKNQPPWYILISSIIHLFLCFCIAILYKHINKYLFRKSPK